MKNHRQYGHKKSNTKKYASVKSGYAKSSAKPRTLTPEQLEKMQKGKEEAKARREAEKAAEEKHRSRLDAVAELDAKLKNAAKEERMYEKYAKQALKSRRRSNHH